MCQKSFWSEPGAQCVFMNKLVFFTHMVIQGNYSGSEVNTGDMSWICDELSWE